MRTETSCDPLRPAAVAIIRRRPVGRAPRWFSMASRVSSETVIRLLSASCLSRVSRSSGSFTVVRFMVCQHTALEKFRHCRGNSSHSESVGPRLSWFVSDPVRRSGRMDASDGIGARRRGMGRVCLGLPNVRASRQCRRTDPGVAL